MCCLESVLRVCTAAHARWAPVHNRHALHGAGHSTSEPRRIWHVSGCILLSEGFKWSLVDVGWDVRTYRLWPLLQD